MSYSRRELWEMQAEYNRLLSEILKSQADSANQKPTKVSPGVYTVPVGGSYSPPGASITTAPFPLDRLKLDDAGNWSSSNKPYDPYAWVPWTDPTTDKPAPATNCDHKWVDIGFQFERLVCGKCNIEKE